MKTYKSPHVRFENIPTHLSQLQGTAPVPPPVSTPLNAECGNTIQCLDPSQTGIISCNGDFPGMFTVNTYLPDLTCAETLPACSVSNVFLDGVPEPSFVCDPPQGPQDCSQGGCLISFDCVVQTDPDCSTVTAELSCTGLEGTQSCANNVPPS